MEVQEENQESEQENQESDQEGGNTPDQGSEVANSPTVQDSDSDGESHQNIQNSEINVSSDSE